MRRLIQNSTVLISLLVAPNVSFAEDICQSIIDTGMNNFIYSSSIIHLQTQDYSLHCNTYMRNSGRSFDGLANFNNSSKFNYLDLSSEGHFSKIFGGGISFNKNAYDTVGESFCKQNLRTVDDFEEKKLIATTYDPKLVKTLERCIELSNSKRLSFEVDTTETTVSVTLTSGAGGQGFTLYKPLTEGLECIGPLATWADGNNDGSELIQPGTVLPMTCKRKTLSTPCSDGSTRIAPATLTILTNLTDGRLGPLELDETKCYRKAPSVYHWKALPGQETRDIVSGNNCNFRSLQTTCDAASEGTEVAIRPDPANVMYVLPPLNGMLAYGVGSNYAVSGNGSILNLSGAAECSNPSQTNKKYPQQVEILKCVNQPTTLPTLE